MSAALHLDLPDLPPVTALRCQPADSPHVNVDDAVLAGFLYGCARTRSTGFKVAACAAVGLHYWADHPGRSTRGRYVWAVDDDQRAHIVHITGGATDEGSAEHVCERAAKRTDGKLRVWSNTPFRNENGVLLYHGYKTTNGVKDSFRGTHVPPCAGQAGPPVNFVIGT